MGGKVQAPPGLRRPRGVPLSRAVRALRHKRICIEICSAQAITPGDGGDARLRPREVRPLRRLPLELPHPPAGIRAREHRVPRRHRRPALGGELREPDGRIPDRRLRQHRARSAPDPGAGDHAAGPGPEERDDAPAVLDPWAGHALYEAANLAPRSPAARCVARPRPQGQAPAGDDDRRPEGAVRAGRARRPGQRLHRRRRGRRRAGRGHRRHPRPRPRRAARSSAAGNRPRAAPARRCRWWASGSASSTSSRAWTS